MTWGTSLRTSFRWIDRSQAAPTARKNARRRDYSTAQNKNSLKRSRGRSRATRCVLTPPRRRRRRRRRTHHEERGTAGENGQHEPHEAHQRFFVSFLLFLSFSFLRSRPSCAVSWLAGGRSPP